MVALGLVVLAAYSVAAVWYLRADSTRGHERAARATRAALALHAVALGVSAWRDELASYAASWSAVGFGVGLAATALATGRLATLGRWLVPVAAGFVAVGLVLPASRVSSLSEVGGSPWLPVHLALVWSALAGLVAEFCVTVVEEVVRRRLKHKQLAGLDAFPALDALARVRLRALGFGVVTLGLGVLAGAAWAAGAMPHQAWLGSPKVAVTVLVWLWYAVALVAHRASDGHARHALVWSAVGFGGLAFLFVGLDFVAEGFHAYGG